MHQINLFTCGHFFLQIKFIVLKDLKYSNLQPLPYVISVVELKIMQPADNALTIPSKCSRAGRFEFHNQCPSLPKTLSFNRSNSHKQSHPMTASAEHVTLTRASAKFLRQSGHSFHCPSPCLCDLFEHIIVKMFPVHHT